MKSNNVIIDRGRGPEIVGTRITVYDVLDWVIEGWHAARIAAFFRISSAEVLAAMAYIQENKLEVLRDYVVMLERCARGNPPELQAKLEANRDKFWKKVQAIRDAKREELADLPNVILVEDGRHSDG